MVGIFDLPWLAMKIDRDRFGVTHEKTLTRFGQGFGEGSGRYSFLPARLVSRLLDEWGGAGAKNSIVRHRFSL